MTFLMDSQIIGQVNINTDYVTYLRSDFGSFDDNGVISYDQFVGSGTGTNEINRLWYKAGNLSGNTESIDLYNLSFSRLGVTATQSFYSPEGESNIKGVMFFNHGTTNLNLKLPFTNHTNFTKVGPSGSLSFYNPNGYSIASSGAVIQVSGSGHYNLSIIGVASPKVIEIDFPFNFETIAPVDIDASSEIEHMELFDGSSYENPIEWLYTALSGGSNTTFRLESNTSPAISSTIPVEYLVLTASYADTRIENSGSISGEQLVNNKFYHSYTGQTEQEFNPSSIPPWEFIYDTGFIVQLPKTEQYNYGEMSTVDFNDIFAYEVSEPSGTAFTNKIMYLGNPETYTKILKLRKTIKLRQVAQATSGTNYNFRYDHNLMYDNTYRYGSKSPQFTIKAGNGTIYYQEAFDEPEIVVVSGQFASVDSSVIMEFEIPAHLTVDPVSWKDEWGLTEYDLADTINKWRILWKVTNPSITKF